MAKPNVVGEILEKEMDRRQFLGFIGAASLVVTGVGGIVAGLTKLSKPTATNGYGSSSYGGSKPRNPRRLG